MHKTLSGAPTPHQSEPGSDANERVLRILQRITGRLVGWLFGFYDISTYVFYLTPNPFLWK